MAVAAVQISPPEPFDFSNSADYPRWIRQFKRFRLASGLSSKPEEYQINSLLYTMGDEADDIFALLSLGGSDREKYDCVVEAFRQHCIGKHNVIFERAQFNRRRQNDSENVETFITAAHKLAEHCNFGALKEELIRDRIVVGIRDRRLSERLQLDPEH